MGSYKEMTQEEAAEMWIAGVRTMDYAPELELYVDGHKVNWIPFTPTPYFWESPYQHYAEHWRVEIE